MTRRERLICAAVALVVALSVASMVKVVGAYAQGEGEAAACPAEPEPDDGLDPVVHELRQLRREQSRACFAQLDALGGLDVTVQSSAADPVHVLAPDPEPATAAADVRVTELPVDVSDALTTTADQTGYLRADVFAVMGLLVASMFFYAIWRTVMPRA